MEEPKAMEKKENRPFGGGRNAGRRDENRPERPRRGEDRPKENAAPDTDLIVGRNAVREALSGGRAANALYVKKGEKTGPLLPLIAEAREKGIPVKEVDGKVIFLRRLERGGSEHSFGIHVAEIAGMPRSIVKRANVILKQLEADNEGVGKAGKPTAEIAGSREGMQLSFFQLDDPVLCQIRDEILGLDINNLTPVEALNKLNDIKKIVGGK